LPTGIEFIGNIKPKVDGLHRDVIQILKTAVEAFDCTFQNPPPKQWNIPPVSSFERIALRTRWNEVCQVVRVVVLVFDVPLVNEDASAVPAMAIGFRENSVSEFFGEFRPCHGRDTRVSMQAGKKNRTVRSQPCDSDTVHAYI
jgi:hypothetical protein